jgi:hypothetical protein
MVVTSKHRSRKKANVMTTTTTATTASSPARRRAARVLAAAAVLAAGAGLAATLGSAAPASASAAPAATAACVTTPSSCGYPDATNTGVPAGTALKTVPGQVSSGPGWAYDPRGWVEVSGNGANLTGLYIPYNLDITASDVTINDDKVMTNGGNFGISLRNTANVTIENSTVQGANATTGRVDTAIKDVYGGSTGTVVENNNVSDFRTAIELSAGQISGNYIHNAGYQAGDHTNGIYNDGGTTALTITGNTIFINRNQTDAITLEAAAPGQQVANKVITGNLLAGGGYDIYGGDSLGNQTSNIVIQNNVFGQQYYTHSGSYGPVAYYDSAATGNTWTGNTYANGQTITAP